MVRPLNKKKLFGIVLPLLLLVFSLLTIPGVEAGVSIPLPPPLFFAAPPAVIVLPETYVYVVPGSDEDIFFYNGWWWRPWEGRWYRSRHYDAGWGYYHRVPSFYAGVPSGWRNDYRDHRWGGRPWNYQPIPHQQLQQNWSTWKENRHWEKQQAWGVQGLRPVTRPQQPSRTVQPKAQAKPQARDTFKPEHSRPPQTVRPNAQPKPQMRRAAKPQQARPQPGEVQQKNSRSQRSNPRQGEPGRGEDGRQERR